MRQITDEIHDKKIFLDCVDCKVNIDWNGFQTINKKTGTWCFTAVSILSINNGAYSH